MADVTGPISSLPGARHQVPPGMTCDDHPDRPAVLRVQGETDSFGSEMVDLCQECADAHRAQVAELGGGSFMGRCGSRACEGGGEVPLFPYRDYDEGMSGPVYYYCRPCRTRIREAEDREFAAECEANRYAADDYYGYDDDHRDDDDDVPEAPISEWYCIRYRGTNQRVRNRTNTAALVLPRREAEKFVRRHKGKLRGRHIIMNLVL